MAKPDAINRSKIRPGLALMCRLLDSLHLSSGSVSLEDAVK